MIKYLLYTFGIAWTLWGVVILGVNLNQFQYGHPLAMICYVIPIISPGISAVIVKKNECSVQEFNDFMRSIINVKKPLRCYIWAIGLPIGLITLPVIASGATMEQPFYMGFILIVPMIIGGGLEEIGWRGFLQSKMEERFSAFSSTLIIAVIWAIWHIPLWFIPWTNQSGWSFLFFSLMVMCFAFLITSIYHSTKSIFMCILCHATINAFWEIVPTNDKFLSLVPALLIALGLFITTQYYKLDICKTKCDDSITN